MSKHETWRTRAFWDQVGGLLIEEFCAVSADKAKGISKRHIDGVIILGEEKESRIGGQYAIKGKDIIVVQTKANTLGMYLMGQALFSKELMLEYEPSSVKTVAICKASDPVMEALCEKYNIEVVVIGNECAPSL